MLTAVYGYQVEPVNRLAAKWRHAICVSCLWTGADGSRRKRLTEATHECARARRTEANLSRRKRCTEATLACLGAWVVWVYEPDVPRWRLSLVCFTWPEDARCKYILSCHLDINISFLDTERPIRVTCMFYVLIHQVPDPV